MNLSQYSDDELLEEVKRRGFKIEVLINSNWGYVKTGHKIKVIIGGVEFELTQ